MQRRFNTVSKIRLLRTDQELIKLLSCRTEELYFWTLCNKVKSRLKQSTLRETQILNEIRLQLIVDDDCTKIRRRIIYHYHLSLIEEGRFCNTIALAA